MMLTIRLAYILLSVARSLSLKAQFASNLIRGVKPTSSRSILNTRPTKEKQGGNIRSMEARPTITYNWIHPRYITVI